MKKIYLYSLILLMGAVIFGCSGQEPQKVVTPQKVVKPAEDKKPATAISAPSKEPTASTAIGYDYAPQGRRDPFRSLLIRESAEKKKGSGLLEQDELQSFRLIAIVWSGDQYHAMITLPDGKSYTVKKGMKIGMDGGTIESITKDSVVVRQLMKDKTGVLKPKDIILRLRTEDEG